MAYAPEPRLLSSRGSLDRLDPGGLAPVPDVMMPQDSQNLSWQTVSSLNFSYQRIETRPPEGSQP